MCSGRENICKISFGFDPCFFFSFFKKIYSTNFFLNKSEEIQNLLINYTLSRNLQIFDLS